MIAPGRRRVVDADPGSRDFVVRRQVFNPVGGIGLRSCNRPGSGLGLRFRLGDWLQFYLEIFEEKPRLQIGDADFQLVAELFLNLGEAVSLVGPGLDLGDLLGGKGLGLAHQME